jgi:hypothetical protein
MGDGLKLAVSHATAQRNRAKPLYHESRRRKRSRVDMRRSAEDFRIAAAIRPNRVVAQALRVGGRPGDGYPGSLLMHRLNLRTQGETRSMNKGDNRRIRVIRVD